MTAIAELLNRESRGIFINLKVKLRFCLDTQHLPSPTRIWYGSDGSFIIFLLFPVFDRLDRISVSHVFYRMNGKAGSGPTFANNLIAKTRCDTNVGIVGLPRLIL
jgi:hypothetical protein